MESIKRFKIIYIVLALSLIFGVTIGGIFFSRLSAEAVVLWYLFIICFVAIPTAAIFFIVVEYQDKTKASIEKAAKEINIISEDTGKKISEIQGFEELGKSVEKAYGKIIDDNKLNEKLNRLLVLAAADPELDKFLNAAIDVAFDITGSNLAAIYIADKVTGKLEIKTSRGFCSDIFTQFDINVGEGFVGQAAAKNEIKIIRNLPDDTVYIAQTFLGKTKPKSIAVIPVTDEDDEVIAVIALGSFFDYDEKIIETCEKISKYTSYAIKNGMYYEKRQRLTSELKFQSQLMQNLNDDLEDKIKERTLFLNNIINSINDTAIIAIDKDNFITIMNKGAERLFGINSENAYGKNINIIANGSSVSEKVINENIYETIINGKANHKGIFEIRDGIKTEVSMELFCLYNDFGEQNGVTIVMRDMSETNKIKAAAQSDSMLADILIRENQTAIVLTDKTGFIKNINKNAKYILSVNGDYKNSKNIADFFEDKSLVKNFIAESLKNFAGGAFKAVLSSGISVKFEISVIHSDLDINEEIKLLIFIH